MGLFDFFKKKKPVAGNPAAEPAAAAPIDKNAYLLEALRCRLVESGFKAARHPQYLSLMVHDELEVATAIMDHPDSHPGILHLMVLTMHPKYFPDGIEENLVGFGSTLEAKVNAAVDNYINTTFLTIIDSLTDHHLPELDFTVRMDDQEVLWHPKLGNLVLQGAWKEHPKHDLLFEWLQPHLAPQLTAAKFHWLKLYVSKQADGTIIGECLFNNEPWEEGLDAITAYAGSWEMDSEFLGLKQFIMFRKCDACDE